MLMLIDASRIHSSPAAIHSAEDVRHRDQGERAEDRAGQEVRTPAAEPSPGAVAHVPDDRLHEQSGQRRRQPEHGDLVGVARQVFVDGAHVGHLQAPAELDAEEAEAHVPDLPEA